MFNKWKALIVLCLAISSVASTIFSQNTLIPVTVGIFEALDLTDSTSSERYRYSMEAAFNYAFGESEKVINKCGYRFRVIRDYFAATDSLAPKKTVEKMEKDGAWVLFGPRRSDQFHIASLGQKQSVLVSPMSESIVANNNHPIFSMYPASKELALAALKALKKENFGLKYGAFIDASCNACREFEAEFDQYAEKTGYQKSFSIDSVGDQPNLSKLIDILSQNHIGFLLLPNKSKFSGYTISEIAKRFPTIKYVGSNGWGDDQYGFLLKYAIPTNVRGLCVRGGKSHQKLKGLLGIHSLDYLWNGNVTPPSYTALMAVRFVRQLSDDLCQHHPKTRQNLYQMMKRFPGNHFKAENNISVLHLANSELKWEEATR